MGDLHPFTGSTPVVKAVAASSSFLGETVVLPLGQKGIAEQVAKAGRFGHKNEDEMRCFFPFFFK